MVFFGCIMAEFDRTTDIDAPRMLFFPCMPLSSEKPDHKSKPRFGHLPVIRHSSSSHRQCESHVICNRRDYPCFSYIDLVGTSLVM